jgi:hypothetical protein
VAKDAESTTLSLDAGIKDIVDDQKMTEIDDIDEQAYMRALQPSASGNRRRMQLPSMLSETVAVRVELRELSSSVPS